jgi:hypothetical protein
MTITPGNFNFTIFCGGTFNYVITWKDQNGALINLMGYSAEMKIRSSLTDPTVLLDLTSSNGGIALGGTAGTVTLNASAATTAALAPGCAVYDLKLTNGSDNEFLLQGTINIQQMVTR